MFLKTLFIIKLLAQINIFKYIERKHGQNIRKLVRRYEDLRTKITRIEADIRYINICKKEKLIPTFARTNLSIKHGTYRLKQKIAMMILTTELRYKHHRKRAIRRELRLICRTLESTLSIVLYNALIRKVTKVVKIRSTAIYHKHKKKLAELRKSSPRTHQTNNNTNSNTNNNNVHNFSSMKLTDKQKDALSRELEQHSPSKNNRISIQTQFEQFYQRLPTTEDQTAEAKTEIKSKVLETYTKYMDIETPYVYEKEVSELKKNKNISILKQDKGRGVVILNKQTYNNKCNQILQSQQFTSCEEDPTKTIEGKVQRAVRKTKSHLTPTEYNKIYPTGSNPGRFYVIEL